MEQIFSLKANQHAVRADCLNCSQTVHIHTLMCVCSKASVTLNVGVRLKRLNPLLSISINVRSFVLQLARVICCDQTCCFVQSTLFLLLCSTFSWSLRPSLWYLCSFLVKVMYIILNCTIKHINLFNRLINQIQLRVINMDVLIVRAK